ncbi:MAG: hypothetical protein IT438_02895 [Phycisphaerales bacterium]|nr:hypothetical protein [Phycisphaerales bacterium]
MNRRGGPFWWLLAAAALSASGCTDPFLTHRKTLETLHAEGRFDEAAALMDSPDGRALYGDKNRLLLWLDRGSVALAQHDPARTITELEKAEDFMEVRREPTAGDEIAKWLLNDTAAPYYGEPYEEQYVNVLKLLAQLEQGNLDGGATVEARRMAGKADVLRDRYLRSVNEADKKGEDLIAGFSPPSLGQRYANPDGEFVESTLGVFLTAVTFMMTGDPGGQSVAARRLMTDIDAQRGLIGPVRAGDFASLSDLRPGRVNTLIVALSGRGPTKEPVRFGPIPIYTYTVYFELPELRGGSAEAARARVLIDDGATATQELAFIEDMRSVATENHRRQLPLIYTRAFIRSSLKAAAVAVGTEAARKGAGSHDARTAIELAGIIGGLLFVSQTERADLRCWTFLPGQAHVGLLDLPPGEHTVKVEYLSDSGGLLYTSPATAITVSPDRRLSTVVEHFWR